MAGKRLSTDHLRQKTHLITPRDIPELGLGKRKGFRRYKVSSVGQITLPASARQRWGIDKGGDVEVADLGAAVVILPNGGSDELLESWLSASDIASEATKLLRARTTPRSQAYE
jgi:bifunctional DNA-binding transcriptional regulator/antitoxin component of YhaV-PrlF toxin-antitoxin module